MQMIAKAKLWWDKFPIRDPDGTITGFKQGKFLPGQVFEWYGDPENLPPEHLAVPVEEPKPKAAAPKRGRPPGSRNKPKVEKPEVAAEAPSSE